MVHLVIFALFTHQKVHIHDYFGPKWKWHSNDWGKNNTYFIGLLLHSIFKCIKTPTLSSHKNIFQLFFGKRSLNMIFCAMSIFHVYLIWHHNQNISTLFAFGASFTILCKISANTLTCMTEAWHFMYGSIKLVTYEIMHK